MSSSMFFSLVKYIMYFAIWRYSSPTSSDVDCSGCLCLITGTALCLSVCSSICMRSLMLTGWREVDLNVTAVTRLPHYLPEIFLLPVWYTPIKHHQISMQHSYWCLKSSVCSVNRKAISAVPWGAQLLLYRDCFLMCGNCGRKVDVQYPFIFTLWSQITKD